MHDSPLARPPWTALVIAALVGGGACAEPAATPADAATAVVDGSAADAAPSVDGAPAACPSGATCQGFEDTAVGAVPGGAWRLSTPSCHGSGSLAVTSAVAHGGGHALEVHGGGGYCDHAFLATDAPADAATVHVRFWVRLASALGDSHVTFVALADRGTGKDLRLGGQARILMWNRESDDATLPALSPTGIARSLAPASGAWLCVQAVIERDAGTLTTRVDGAVVPGLVIDATPTPDIDEPWLRPGPWPPALTDLRIGWESYAGQTMTLWFDDVAIGTGPLGCD